MPKIKIGKPLFPMYTIWRYLIASSALMLLSMPYVLTQYNEDVHTVEATPALSLRQKELTTTVLLVSNEASDTYRRFHSLRSEVGLLTSTARTFIQNGITTEYATQVLGTTLDNGRVYAQYLKKSSRVLYESPVLPSVVTMWVGDSTILPQSHNDLHNADRADWQDQDDRLRKVFVGNTDFVGDLYQSSMKEMDETATKTSMEKLSSQFLIENKFTPSFVGRESEGKADFNKLAAQKVLPIEDLPTYTVKNSFSPSRFSWDHNKNASPQTSSMGTRSEETNLAARTPKLYYQQVMGLQSVSEVPKKLSNMSQYTQPRKLATTTYFGFADFTTIVGDSVIVFSPSSSSEKAHQGQVTSIKGEATLGDISTPQVSYVSIKVTEDIIVPSSVLENHIVETDKSTLESLMGNYLTLTETVQASEPSETPKNDFSKASSTASILSSLPLSTSQLLSRPSDEEVSAIFALLQKSVAQSSVKIEPSSIPTLGGATTIYFEDDPFANFVKPVTAPINNSTALRNENITEVTKSTDFLEKVVTNLSAINLNISITKERIPITSKYSVVSTVVSTPTEKETKISPTLTTSGVIIREIDHENEYSTECMRTSQIFLTQLPKQISLLTTYFTVVDSSSAEIGSPIETSIINTYEILETTKKYCIQSTPVAEASLQTVNLLQSDNNNGSKISSQTDIIIEVPLESTNNPEDTDDITTTTPDSDLDWGSGNDPIEEEDESVEEYDLIYKTLYTTYTYLTTIFQESSSSILSRTEVITNIVSSTLGSDEQTVNEQLETDIAPTASLDSARRYTALNDLNSLIRQEEDSQEENENFDTLQIEKPNDPPSNFEINTFHTTYTYFTSIFTEGETEVISRTEVLTNVITVTPSKTQIHESTSTIKFTEIPDVESTISTLQKFSNDGNKMVSAISLNYSTMTRNSSGASITPKFDEYSSVTLVTDVRSSSSHGEGHIINDESMRSSNNSLQENLEDDQISSESNTDEIVPSATLLLQTSFTTFTYYTTMYNNNNTNVISRLETITDVVTETFDPTLKSGHIEEATLPVTYFTTFTYWTKLAKDGIISTLSREETISNIVTPSNVYTENERTSNIISSQFEVTKSPAEENTLSTLMTLTKSAIVDTLLQTTLIEPTTYYTTYTYYTTSYESENTITNSRFETVTNIVTPTVSVNPDFNEIETQYFLGGSSTKKNSTKEGPPKAQILLYDYKKIIDADGVSTLFFETQVTPSINENGVEVEVTSSSSNLYIDENKKTTSATALLYSTNSDGSTIPIRQYKTGLVRLIEGTRIGNHTTTLYQSRVIGTLIENRYAQIIESTSSFIFETGPSLSNEITPSKTEYYIMEATQQRNESVAMNSNIGALETSTGDSTNIDDQSDQDNSTPIYNDTGDDNSGKEQSTLQTKKPIFAPVIRPFASRNRPQFAPKKKSGIVSSATIITRSDFTPTITATPALKSTNRFISSRKSGTPQNNFFGQSSSRRFSRPGKQTTNPYQSLATDNETPSSSFGGGRNRFGVSSRGTGIASGGSTRRLNSLARSSIPGSANIRPGFSSGYTSNARQRIKPTAAFAFGQSSTSTELPANLPPGLENSDEESSTQEQTNDDENEGTTENSRRNQNPLLRFRRPLTRPSELSGGITNQRGGGGTSSNVSSRRNPFTTRPKAQTSVTTTTTSPKARPKVLQRPTVAAFAGRQRPQNSLFPPRGLFQNQKQDTPAPNVLPNKEAQSETADNDDDADYEEEEDGEETEDDGPERKRRSHLKTSAKNVEKPEHPNSSAGKGKSRSKREADKAYLRTNFRNRFRRPTASHVSSIAERKTEDQTTPENFTQQPAGRAGRKNSRFGNKQHSSTSTTATTLSHRAIRPTRPNNNRAQFTLREKDLGTTTKSYQRHNSASRRRVQTTISSRRTPPSISSNRRLKSYANNNSGSDGSQRNSGPASKPRGNSINTSRSRTSTSRGRHRNEFNMDVLSNAFDGTITVTHVIPSEVTIPVVNGQLTEFKNIITAKTSTEILSPQQYTSFIGTNGQPTLALTREESMTNAGGATEITQFILHGSATTTITFTPTTIRGRKTSFSHILPSTIYSVEKLVSTMQPQLANAPLANILLSQLLLGNIGLPGQAPGNPLIGALTQLPITTQTPMTPITEYRTHTSTYVTTIFEGMSTVVPVTFQGKKILTTVYDTTAQTITATEFVTDTIITTPTQQPPQANQVNSLLLQQLLLQHQLQPNYQQEIQSQAPLKELLQPESNIREIDSNNIQDRDEETDSHVVEENQLLKTTTSRKKQRKSGKSGHRRNKQQQGTSSIESSVITLYVSGRRPGEFSTILSTVLPNSDSTLQKRQVDAVTVDKTHAIENGTDFYAADSSDFVSEYVLPEQFDGPKQLTPSQNENHLSHNLLDSSEAVSGHTQTLESIVGDVGHWFEKSLVQLPKEDLHYSPTLYDANASLNSLE